MQNLGGASLVCFVDALDECNESDVRDMISFFEQIGEVTASAGTQLRICFSSRHYPEITIKKGLNLILEDQTEHTEDITKYTNSELRIGQTKLAKQIYSELQEKAVGVFMLVVLVVGILNKEHDRGKIHKLRQRLRELPGDLHELFRDILTRDALNKEQMLLCIQWVLFARRPLKPTELYFAVLADAEPETEILSDWEPSEDIETVVRRFILSTSKGLAEITRSKDPTVQFIHESVKDFPLKTDGLRKVWPNLGDNFEAESHERLKQFCLSRITSASESSSITRSHPPSPATIQDQELSNSPGKADSEPLFLKYAVQNVLHHANTAEKGGVSQVGFLLNLNTAHWTRLYNRFEQHDIRRYPLIVSLLYILAEDDLAALIKASPRLGSCFDPEETRYGPPLWAALARESSEVISALLEIEIAAEIAAQPDNKQLHDLGKKYLTGQPKHINLGRSFKLAQTRPVISYLAQYCDEVLVAFMLASGKAELESKGRDGRTPLSWAAGNGRDATVKMLLAMGADMPSSTKQG